MSAIVRGTGDAVVNQKKTHKNPCPHGCTQGRQRSQASLTAQRVKNLPAMQETWVLSLEWEDPLEKGMATQASILAWRIP